MAKGWISLHRKLQDCWIWNGEPFTRGQAWVDILLSATHDDYKKLIGGNLVTIHSGQLHTSISQMARRWKWSEKKVRHYLGLLEDDGMVLTEGNAHGTTLTIINYGFYQGEGRTVDTTDDTKKGELKIEPKTSRGQTYNNINNNINNNNRGTTFTPPSVDEVRSYCSERKNGIDAQTFIDFYSSKGWMIGKNKMKDWKAAIRTWEKRHKESKPTQFHQMEQNTYDYDDLEKRLLGGG